jgi:hypothetical protein
MGRGGKEWGREGGARQAWVSYLTTNNHHSLLILFSFFPSCLLALRRGVLSCCCLLVIFSVIPSFTHYYLSSIISCVLQYSVSSAVSRRSVRSEKGNLSVVWVVEKERLDSILD